MQDQLTGGSATNLQQQKGDLQQNTPNLQQSGTPTSTANTSSILSDSAPKGDLRVSTTTTTAPSSVQPDLAHPSANHIWLLLLIIPVLLVVTVLWPRPVLAPAVEEELPEQQPDPVAAVPKKATKPKKKSSKRKKSGRR